MRANRPNAPKLFRNELRRVFELLSAYPNAGALCEDPDLPGVRRILLPATKHYLYYQVQEAEQRIVVLAVWSTHRGDRPAI